MVFTFLMVGCAQTRLYDHGNLVAVIQGDATNITVRSDALYFHADTLSHSTATAAVFSGMTAMVGGLGAAVTSAIIAIP
jgi:hypothetical protein